MWTGSGYKSHRHLCRMNSFCGPVTPAIGPTMSLICWISNPGCVCYSTCVLALHYFQVVMRSAWPLAVSIGLMRHICMISHFVWVDTIRLQATHIADWAKMNNGILNSLLAIHSSISFLSITCKNEEPDFSLKCLSLIISWRHDMRFFSYSSLS